ncbi:MAG TPA: hypothetical protein DCP31_32695 [Cyanobacteria bacterium UBA8543]|nr:hypothetical protein [Cyanobacteria bacterium UBA8543]
MILLYKQLEEVRNSFKEQLIERALDIITAKPNRTGNPRYIARNALSDARKVLKRRVEIVRFVAPAGRHSTQDILAEQPDYKSTSQSKITEIFDWILSEPCLNSRDRLLLLNIAQDENAVEIAARTDVCVKAVRKNISRVRARIHAAWQEVI